MTDVGCPACDPAVDLAAVAAVASTPRWQEAAQHRRPATRAVLGLVGAIVLALAGAGLVSVAPAGLVPGAAFVAVGLVLAAVAIRTWRTPLRPWPAAVLGSTVERIQDGKGRSTFHYALHVIDRDGQRHALVASDAQVAAHAAGTAVIAFTRGDHLDDAWAARRCRGRAPARAIGPRSARAARVGLPRGPRAV